MGSRPTGGTQIILLNMSGTKRKPGPEAERVKIEGDWEDAVDVALRKKRPVGGWPKPDSENSSDSTESEENDSHSSSDPDD